MFNAARTVWKATTSRELCIDSDYGMYKYPRYAKWWRKRATARLVANAARLSEAKTYVHIQKIRHQGQRRRLSRNDAVSGTIDVSIRSVAGWPPQKIHPHNKQSSWFDASMADIAWDLYRILGTSRAATGDEIRTAYRELAITHHPDKGGDPTLWTRIQQAYTTLSDSTSRASYDRNAGDEVDTGAGKQFASGFVEQVDTKSKKDGLNIGQHIEAAKLEEDKMKDASKGMLTQAGLNMSHSAGFEAFLRNQKGTGRMGFYTAEDLLRKGNIAATDATAQSLPPLTTTAVRFDAHGDPAQVRRRIATWSSAR
eukprot:4652383-Pleurochrysis_carterae.AAC.1